MSKLNKLIDLYLDNFEDYPNKEYFILKKETQNLQNGIHADLIKFILKLYEGN